MVGKSWKRRFAVGEGQNEWCDFEYQGAKAKAPPCPNSTLQTPLPQQSSSSAREEEDHWEVMEERRRRRIAFENLAKGMLILDNCNDVIARTSGGAVAIRYLHSASGTAGDERRWPQDFRRILARRRIIMYCQLGQTGGAAERLSRLGKKVSRVGS